jgi:predicted secreted Zn-dependent protease
VCPVQDEWTRFLSAIVEEHEPEHVQLIKNYYDGFGKKITGKTLQQAASINDRIAGQLQNQII